MILGTGYLNGFQNLKTEVGIPLAITIRDIAKLCNVSTTTVSKVLNGKLESVSQETAEKVNAMVKKMDYQPNALARSLNTKKTNTIALMVPDICNPFFSDLARGVEDVCNAEGYSLFLCNTDGIVKKEEDYTSFLISRNVDGIIFTTQNNEEYSQNFRKFLDEQYPFVFIERYVKDLPRVSGVYVNNLEGAYTATKYLLGLGHRKIAFITGPLSTENSRLRLDGFRRAMEEAQVGINQSIIVNGNYKTSGGYDAASYLLTKHAKEFTAIFASNDLMALGAYQLLKENSIGVPEEISLMGFDDIHYPEALEPKLTTVKIPSYEMGQTAVHMILDLIHKKKLKYKAITYDLDIVKGQTTTELKR